MPQFLPRESTVADLLHYSTKYGDEQTSKMVSTGNLTAEKLFSVKGFVCVVTGGGTGIGLMYFTPLTVTYVLLNLLRATQALAPNGAKFT